jgi:hypothetical protein
MGSASVLIAVDTHNEIAEEQWRVSLTIEGPGAKSLQEATEEFQRSCWTFAETVQADANEGGRHG